VDIAFGLGKVGMPFLAFNSLQTDTERSEQSGLMNLMKGNCTFDVVDFLKGRVEGAPFGFVFDRGCFHVMASSEDRHRFAQQAHSILEEGGLWLSLIGNADERRDGGGPPQRSARDIVIAAEPFFEILSLVSSHFETHLPTPPRAWACLMRKRRNEFFMA